MESLELLFANDAQLTSEEPDYAVGITNIDVDVRVAAAHSLIMKVQRLPPHERSS